MELSNYEFSPLREGDLPIQRGRRDGLSPILVVALQEQNASDESVKRLEHEYGLRAELDIAWAARPIALTRLCVGPWLTILRSSRASPALWHEDRK